jgi:ubiquinone/menaquinone biosynthesis C-methylase UbiE
MRETRNGISSSPATATNVDPAVVAGFGDEWSRFDQSNADQSELRAIFDAYFSIFPWNDLQPNAVGFDLGCGSGRWARFVAPRVRTLHCIDASQAALDVAHRTLGDQTNVQFHCASVDSIPLPDASADFGYSLGVLHHVPDTESGLRDTVRKLKPGAPMLIYLYYAFDNRPAWFRYIWKASELARFVVARSPHPVRYAASQILAAAIYFPLARTAAVAERLGANVEHWPLSPYRDRSFYVMRTDALDRFGTRLEQRFTQAQIRGMMERCGLTDIRFRTEGPPFWVAVGIKR